MIIVALATVGALGDGDLEAITEDEEKILERQEEKRKHTGPEDADVASIMDGLSKREVMLLSKLLFSWI